MSQQQLALLLETAPVVAPQPSAPFQRHSPTSRTAAALVEPNAGTLRADVLAYLRSRPDGATDDEIQVALDMNPSTQRPRRIELTATLLVRDSGRVRKTRGGRNAVVWEAV